MDGTIPTCWVIDHPAHFQFLSPFIRGGHADDILIMTTRPEVQSMFRTREGRIPHRPHLWVDRPVGHEISRFSRFRIARNRVKRVREFLTLHPTIKRIIVKGASLELISAKKAGISDRVYISDTEVNYLAHRIARRYATRILIPKSWGDQKYSGFSSDPRVERYSGILPELYLDLEAGKSVRKQAISQIREELNSLDDSLSMEPVVFHRSIIGGGIHDNSELILYDAWIKNLQVHFVHTKESAIESSDGAWELPIQIAMFDGVLTGSSTMASEAVIHGIPTLLISAAERGFLDELQKRFPEKLFHWKSRKKEGFDEMVEDWIDSMKKRTHRDLSIIESRPEFEEKIGPFKVLE